MTTFRVIRDHMDLRPTTGQLLAFPDLDLLTLELPWANNAIGQSCIPTGNYRCILSRSTRFNRVMPELLNVPGRTGIRFHGGNTTADTEGCILLGMEWQNPNVLFHSQSALGFFINWLEESLTEDKVYCEVSYGEWA